VSPGPAATMDGSKGTGGREVRPKGLGAEEEKLDRALVAGLMLEVILETAGPPADPQAFRHLVKVRLKDTLVTHLAGRVTLDRFHHLLRTLDHWFPLYYPLINAGSPKGPGRAVPVPAGPASPARRGLREDRLRAWLREEGRDLLPRRPHRKLSGDKLREFLGRTQGGWFRLRDFEQHFGVDRKTAWEYLHNFLHAGLLRHNQGRSAAVRYGLAAQFLVVRADALEPKVREALRGLPRSLAEEVSGRIIAAGGEAFRPEEWHDCLEPLRCQQVISRLQAAGILAEVGQVGESRMLRIEPLWLGE
jgi:hypothetical protein